MASFFRNIIPFTRNTTIEQEYVSKNPVEFQQDRKSNYPMQFFSISDEVWVGKVIKVYLGEVYMQLSNEGNAFSPRLVRMYEQEFRESANLSYKCPIKINSFVKWTFQTIIKNGQTHKKDWIEILQNKEVSEYTEAQIGVILERLCIKLNIND